jgi:U32 family peptidase
VLNGAASSQLTAMGIRHCTLSPEDGLANMASLLGETGCAATVILYQDTPLFISETCAFASSHGGCPGLDRCRFQQMTMTSGHGETLIVLNRHCRSVAVGEKPYCIARHLDALRTAGARRFRADFINRSYEPEGVLEIWRGLRSGRAPALSHVGNASRGLA